MKNSPPPVQSIQKAQRLGRPVTHDDINPGTARQFFAQVATRSRGWEVPTETSPTPVMARLDAGRWLADCPICDGAELVSVSDPVFFCLSCSSGGMWWPVEWPVDRAEIEAEVIKRSDLMGWAWNPGETLADLEAETRRRNP